MKSPAELTDLFRAKGLKVTPQRQAIFEAMHDNTSHPTAEAVHGAVCTSMPTVSLRTVYQTLNDLADMGEISQIDLGTGSARFDPNLGKHHHMVCDRCGGVHDVPADFTDVRLPADLGGFEVSSTEVIVRGQCPTCRAGGG